MPTACTPTSPRSTLAGGGAIFEPVGRNTAAAVAVATLQTLDALSATRSCSSCRPTTRSRPTRQFWQTIEAGVPAATTGRLVVFGIKPTQPETGYGYIEVAGGGGRCSTSSRFVEKPDLETAEALSRRRQLLLEHRHLPVPRRRHARRVSRSSSPEIWEAAEAALAGRDQRRFRPLHAARPLRGDPLDLDRLRDHGEGDAASPWCRPASAGTISAHGSRCSTSARPTRHGNVIVGDVVAIDCENSYFRSDGRLLSAIGLKNVAIVSTPDATFVAPVSHSQNVKKIVEQLEKSGRLETKFTPAHDRVHRQRRLAQAGRPLAVRGDAAAVVDRRRRRASMAASTRRSASTAGRCMKPKRMRTMARQVYAFAVAKARGWDGPGRPS